MTGLAGTADVAAWQKRMPRAFGAPPAVRIARYVGFALLVVGFGLALWRLKFSATRFFGGLGEMGHIIMLLVPPDFGAAWLEQVGIALAQTIAMAFLGTLIAFLIALPLSFLAAANIVPSLVLRQVMRRLFDVLRGVEQIIWALVFVSVVGLGPFAGILAIVVAEVGILAKLFSEAIESADGKPIESVRAAGGSFFQQLRLGLVPQVLPSFISTALYQFESNTRSATILGMVGAGGVGLLFSEMTRTFEWGRVGTLLLAVWLAVAVIDRISQAVRSRV